MLRSKDPKRSMSRRAFLKRMGVAPTLLHPAPFHGLPFLITPPNASYHPALPLAEYRLTPSYPTKSPLEDVLRRVAPGTDEFVTEKYAFEIEAMLVEWSRALRTSVGDLSVLTKFLDPSIEASSWSSAKEIALRGGDGIEITRRQFGTKSVPGRDHFLREFRDYLGPVSQVETAEFEITSVEEIANSPLALRLAIRFDIVATRSNGQSEERVGYWNTEWFRDPSDAWRARKWQATEETRSSTNGSCFIDVTHQALGATSSYKNQMLRGSDYWRTVLDGACGIDVYGNNGIAAGDFDNDGFDDFYVCQPAGLPNRLYRNRGDGTFEDVTEKSGVGVLDNTVLCTVCGLREQGAARSSGGLRQWPAALPESRERNLLAQTRCLSVRAYSAGHFYSRGTGRL